MEQQYHQNRVTLDGCRGCLHLPKGAECSWGCGSLAKLPTCQDSAPHLQVFTLGDSKYFIIYLYPIFLPKKEYLRHNNCDYF